MTITSFWTPWRSTIRVHMALSLARPMFQFIVFLQPFVLSTIAYFVYGHGSQLRLVNYVVLGTGFTTLWSSIVFSSASDVNRERYYGTLETIFCAPVPFAVTLLGKIVGNTVLGLLSMVISLLYLLAVFRVRVPIYHPGWLVLASCIVFGSLVIFSFFLAMAFTLSRQAETLMNFAEFPIYVVCGFLFPVSVLPVWLHPLAYALPPTWTIELLRTVMQSTVDSIMVWQHIGWLTLLNTGYILLGFLCYTKMETRVRAAGKLGVY